MFAAASQREKKEEERMIYVGIDVHKRRCHSALMTEKGDILDELTFENNSQGLSTLVERIQPLGEAKAVLESTGNLWIRTYEALEAANIQVSLSNPLKTRAIAEARIKTDKIDARTLAHLLRADLVAKSYVPDKETRARRSLLRHRASMVKTRTELKNRVHNLPDKYDLHSEASDLFGRKGLEWLRNLQLPAVDTTILNSDLQLLEALDNQILNMNVEIARLACNQEDVKLLMTMPGVDYYAAMIISSEIGNVKRFSSPEKLASWAGLVPSLHQSGSKTRRGHQNKAHGYDGSSSRQLRTATEATPDSNTYTSESQPDEETTRPSSQSPEKMLTVAYYMLTRHEEYRGMNHDRYKEKLKRLEQTAKNGLQQ